MCVLPHNTDSSLVFKLSSPAVFSGICPRYSMYSIYCIISLPEDVILRQARKLDQSESVVVHPEYSGTAQTPIKLQRSSYFRVMKLFLRE